MVATVTIRRRALPLLALAAVSAPALADTLDLAVTCDTTLAPALRRVAAVYKARTGAQVFVFPTGPGLILPQLVRNIQNDIVVTQTTILEQAAQAGVIAAVACSAQWRNPLVIAGLQGATAIDRALRRERSNTGVGYRRPRAPGTARHHADARARRGRYR